MIPSCLNRYLPIFSLNRALGQFSLIFVMSVWKRKNKLKCPLPNKSMIPVEETVKEILLFRLHRILDAHGFGCRVRELGSEEGPDGSFQSLCRLMVNGCLYPKMCWLTYHKLKAPNYNQPNQGSHHVRKSVSV